MILDIVFNHTAEGNDKGLTLSFRGLDNRVYYMLAPGGEYYNYSGCGNTFNCNHPVVRQFIVDCLRYWVTGACALEGPRCCQVAAAGVHSLTLRASSHVLQSSTWTASGSTWPPS